MQELGFDEPCCVNSTIPDCWKVGDPRMWSDKKLARGRFGLGQVGGTFTARYPPLSASILASSRCLRAPRASGYARRFELHHHHQEIQPVPAPASQPRYLPIAEARPQRDRCAEAKELGFQLHLCWSEGQHIHCSAIGMESSPAPSRLLIAFISFP